MPDDRWLVRNEATQRERLQNFPQLVLHYLILFDLLFVSQVPDSLSFDNVKLCPVLGPRGGASGIPPVFDTDGWDKWQVTDPMSTSHRIPYPRLPALICLCRY